MAPRTREELLAYGVPDPALLEAVAQHPLRQPLPTDPYYGRKDFLAIREHRATVLREKHHLRYLPGPIPNEVREEDRMIPMRDGAEIRVRAYLPVGESDIAAKSGRPLIVLYHEGAWSMGDLTDEEVNCRLFSREFGAICVNVEYRLAPEHPFPTGINDSWDALKWVASNASSLGADPTKGFIIGGGSAGGNITAILAHLARDEKLSPPLTGQYLCVPAIMCLAPPEAIPEPYRAEYLSHPQVTPCEDPLSKNEDPDVSGNPVVEALKPDPTSPLFIPFLYGGMEGGHTGLPPAYFQVAGLDRIRDEGLIYERVLREEAGVKTKLDVYGGFGHYFWTNWPMLEASKKFVEDTVEGLRWLLEQK